MKNYDLTYEWLDFLALQKSHKKAITEEVIRDYVSGNVAKTAAAVGAIDKNFTKGSGDSIKLDPSWQSENISSVVLHDGQTIPFNKNYAELLRSTFEKACEATRNSSKGYYCPRNNGGFNPRTMRGKEKISNHAFGTAIDFETAGTQAEVANHPEFINTMKAGDGKIGFIWGGDWPPEYYDPMHFEVDFSGNPPPAAGTPGPTQSMSYDSYSGSPSRFQGFGQTFLQAIGAYNEGLDRGSSLSDDQIAKLLYDVGFRDEDLVTAVRIVLGESSGNPRATNINRGAGGKYKDSVDRGLFQFNNVAFPNLSDEDAFNPIRAAQEAFRVYKKQGGFVPGRSAWWGKTKFHTLKQDGSPDTDRINRAQKAVQNLTGYVSTGKFEYLGANALGDTTKTQNVIGGSTSYGTPSRFQGFGQTFLQSIGAYNESVEKEEKLFHIKDKSSGQIYKKHKKYFDSLLNYLKKELKITKKVEIVFEEDKENSKKVLGRTGGYLNDEWKIHIFVSDRHIKDILRSLAHEMVHHKQNIRGEFENKQPTIHGYAQKNPHLRKMEKEAYLKGNILFRDWEDNYKNRGNN